MAKKTKAILSLEAQRQHMQGLRDLSMPEFIPFKSDILNLFTGGVAFGGITEIAGDPNLFKSTISAEVIGAAIAMGAHVIVHDKERKLDESRFSTLGIHSANKANTKFWYFAQDWPAYRLTIEQYFTDVLNLFTSIRHDDLQKVKRAFDSNIAIDEAYDYYRRYLPAAEASKARTASRAKTLAARLTMPSMLRKQDRSYILTVLDSTTATPADEEAPDENGEVKKESKAVRARVWSEQLRNMMWVDDCVAGLHVAQKRMHLNFGGNSYKKAAVTTAQEFHYNCRIMTVPMAGGKLTRNPEDNTITIGSPSKVSVDNRRNQVGQIILAKINKSLKGVNTEVPLFMLAQTGTDVINSMWQFLVNSGAIKHHHQGKYKFVHELFAKMWPNERFNPVTFIKFYQDEGQRLWHVLQQYMHLMLTGRVPEEEKLPEAKIELPSPFDGKKPAKKTASKRGKAAPKSTKKKAAKKTSRKKKK